MLWYENLCLNKGMLNQTLGLSWDVVDWIILLANAERCKVGGGYRGKLRQNQERVKHKNKVIHFEELGRWANLSLQQERDPPQQDHSQLCPLLLVWSPTMASLPNPTLQTLSPLKGPSLVSSISSFVRCCLLITVHRYANNVHSTLHPLPSTQALFSHLQLPQPLHYLCTVRLSF